MLKVADITGSIPPAYAADEVGPFRLSKMTVPAHAGDANAIRERTIAPEHEATKARQRM